MHNLIIKSQKKIDAVSLKFKRYLYNEININNKLISVLGARGVGKTTLLLQIANSVKNNKQVLYVALDDLFFTNSTVYSLAEDFSKLGGEILFLDEVHKYPNWSQEIKLIYDDFENLQVFFTSSSILDIYRGEADLSRRAIKYNLKEMSFREYLILYENIELPKLSLSEIITNNSKITLQLTKHFKPLKYYQDYIKVGAYPYFNSDIEEYYQQVLNTINLILEVDLPSIENVEYSNIVKIKRLLYVLSTNVPFTPNISKLSEKISLPRNNLVKALQWLQKAELIHTLLKTNKSVSVLSKPDKIWLHNTTLNYVLSNNNINIGNIRETFFLQHTSVFHNIALPKKADFIIDKKYTFEIGGKNKNRKQIQDIENAFIVKDDIETGVMNIIPLWIFGLMY